MATNPITTDKDIALHDPRLYARRAVAPGIPGGFDAVTDAHIQQYRELGFLSIEDAFTPDEVRDGIAGLLHLIGGGNAEFKSIQFEAKAAANLDSLTIEQKQDAVRKLMWFTEFEPRLKALSHHPKLLALVERLLGTKAPTMFQDMALLKPPRLGREKPWHQDKAYFNIDPRERVVGVWIALDAATTDNGCMHLLPQLPRQPIVHFQRRDWQICDAEILGNECVATPLRPGGVLLFDGLLVHGTPHNTSDQRRRAVQFHYHGNQFPKVRDEDRMALFGSEGKDVEC
jgi:phytanoyl-CoA hydroxylase